jgi:hypothetical protein
MTLLAAFGVMLGLAIFPVGLLFRTKEHLAALTAAYIVHLACTFTYYNYTVYNGGDSLLYYYDEWGFFDDGFGFSTHFVIWLVQSLKLTIGGTFFDYFVLFQAFGFWGIGLLFRTFQEIYAEVEVKQPQTTYLLLFLPGLQFWTSAIGKDGPLFLAVCLSIWALARLRTRFFALGAGLAIMVVFRPYVGLVAMIALAVMVLTDTRTKLYVKAPLLLVALGGVVYAAVVVRQYFEVDVTNAESLSNYFEANAVSSQSIEGTTQVVGASWPLRLFSLMFRPFFYDARDPLALIASFDNALLLVFVGMLALNLRTLLRAIAKVMFLRFAFLFGAGMIILLSYTYYNVGLGLRQKTMFVPCILTLYVALLALRTSSASQVAPPLPSSPVGVRWRPG